MPVRAALQALGPNPSLLKDSRLGPATPERLQQPDADGPQEYPILDHALEGSPVLSGLAKEAAQLAVAQVCKNLWKGALPCVCISHCVNQQEIIIVTMAQST